MGYWIEGGKSGIMGILIISDSVTQWRLENGERRKGGDGVECMHSIVRFKIVTFQNQTLAGLGSE